MNLIDREAAIVIAERYGCDNGSTLGRHSGVADCIASELAKLPAVDVEPVKRGKWLTREYGDGWGGVHYQCSACGQEWYLVDGTPEENGMNYCPHCGAKMEVEE